MNLKTKNPPSGVGSKHNKQQIDDILSRRAHLTKSLTHFVSIGDLCQQWAQDIAKREGLVNV